MPNVLFHGFDSFEGLPVDWRGYAITTKTFDLHGVMPTVNRNVRLHKGWFSDTLPRFLEEYPGDIAFIQMDCDIYESTSEVFTLCKDRIKPGTLIHFDEYFNFPGWRNHEYKAFQEFIAATGLKYRYIAFGYQQAAVVIER